MINFTDTPMSFGFRHKPFNTTEADFFFINTSYLDAYIQLLEGIRQHRGLLVLTGKAGMGKTLLLRKLANEAPANIKFVYCYSTNLDFDNLLTVIGNQLGVVISEQEFSERLKSLNEYFSDCFIEGTDIALLIDDAHHLSGEVLNNLLALSHLEYGGGHAAQIILSGMPLLEEILAKTQVFHAYLDSAIHIELKPLAAADVIGFISRQVQNADGPAIESLFPLSVIERIDHYTNGIPRLINTLCERALLITQIKGHTTVSIATVDEAASELMLKNKEMVLSPATDLFSLEMTHTGSFSQAERIEKLLAKSENFISDETQSIARPIAADELETYAPTVILDNIQYKKKHFALFNPTKVQLVLLVMLALLAGLLGGTGSIYLYPLLSGRMSPSGKIEPSTPVSISVQPAATIESVPVDTTVPVSPDLKANLPKAPLELSPVSMPPTEVAEPVAQIELPPTSPSPSMSRPFEESSISFYMNNGDLLLTQGDVASARLYYEAAANAGFAPAITAIGKTYDPVVLGELGIKGFHAEPVKAVEWYLKGEKTSDPENIERLNELRRWLSESPVLEENEVETLRQLLR